MCFSTNAFLPFDQHLYKENFYQNFCSHQVVDQLPRPLFSRFHIKFWWYLCDQQIAFKNLVEHNRRSELETGGPPDPGSVIRLPFIVVNTNRSTVIDCSISDDKWVVALLLLSLDLILCVFFMLQISNSINISHILEDESHLAWNYIWCISYMPIYVCTRLECVSEPRFCRVIFIFVFHSVVFIQFLWG